jgi:hypothetical protein
LAARAANVVVEHKTIRETLQEMEELLCGVANATAAPRADAVRYTNDRSALLESELRSALPGFLVQCTSINKFHDFIILYDSRRDARISFIAASLANAWALLESRRVYDVFGEGEF